MKAVVQRVLGARLEIGGAVHASIGRGLVVLLGVEEGDAEADRVYIADKIANLRVFSDEARKMNLSVQDVRAGVLMVPNFTLAGDCRKGRRPSFDRAMKPPMAKAEFDAVCAAVRAVGGAAGGAEIPVAEGVFGADMLVRIDNDGPVTLWLDSRA
jgi:D-tyrosyl-tRNA(Tyr) deacylase